MASNALKRPGEDDGSAQRKVRKGTQSCWECKRRKVRCTFADPTNSICEPCTQRGTLCVSQELPDPGRTLQIDDRVSRVEALLEDVLRRLPAENTDHDGSRRSQQSKEATPEVRLVQSSASPVTAGSIPRPSLQETPATSSSSNEFDHIFRSLLDAMPSQHDLQLISREPFEVPNCLHGLPCIDLSGGKPNPLEVLRRLPPPNPHPNVLAKNLLVLASFVQTLSQSAGERLSLLGLNHQRIARDTVRTVHQYVLCNDDLVHTVDGIECLAIESMYHNNAGSLRKAWLTLRRALSIAQFLGIDRRTFQHVSYIDLLGRPPNKEESIWLHLLSSDRYLSLMLGLPQGAPHSRDFATPEAMAPCTPQQRLQRTHCLAGGIMLKYPYHSDANAGYIEEIDVLLREAAAIMQPQWWLIPDLARERESVPSSEILRLMIQLTHYHIVARLHLPYLLQSPAECNLERHKQATVTASREILMRYVALRSSNSTNNYCRGVDFVMFIASTTLCIAHINSSHWRRYSQQYLQFDPLGHQRPSDRGLVERAVDTMQGCARPGDDEIEARIGGTLRHLLDMESKAATGAIFAIAASESNETSGSGGSLGSDGTLKIDIPYIGTIKIERDRISGARSSTPLRARAVQGSASQPTTATTSHFDVGGSLSRDDCTKEWPLQGVDVALFDALVQDWDFNVDNI